MGIVSSKETSRNYWRLPAAALNGLPENFPTKIEEITIRCLQVGLEFKTNTATIENDSGIEDCPLVLFLWIQFLGNNRVYGEGFLPFGQKWKRNPGINGCLLFLSDIATEIAIPTKMGKTCVPLHRSGMEIYNLQEETDITIAMKEFKVNRLQKKTCDIWSGNYKLTSSFASSLVSRRSSLSQLLFGYPWIAFLTRTIGKEDLAVISIIWVKGGKIIVFWFSFELDRYRLDPLLWRLCRTTF